MNNLAIDIIKEQFKVIESFEYFLDEYVWIEDKATNTPIKLELWPEQRRVIPQFLNARLLTILKAHQLGYTWIFVAAYCLWESIRTGLFQAVINSFNEDAGKEIVDRANFIKDRLPAWLVPPLGIDTTLKLKFLHHNKDGIEEPSVIQVIPATEKGGQSKTPNVMIFDESCFNRYVAKAYNGSLPGITQAKGKIIFISNSIKTAPGWSFTRSIYSGSMKGDNDFDRIFLPWWANPTRSRKIIPGKFDSAGRPMTEFKMNMLRSGGMNGGQMDDDDFSQRYPETEEEAISTIGGSYFEKTLARHDAYLMDGDCGMIEKDNHGEIVFKPDPRGILEVWRVPYMVHDDWDQINWRYRYVIGSDISEGLGRTYSVAYVLDRKTQEMVARLRSNRIDAYNWGDCLQLLSKWYDNAVIVPERTGAGITTCDRLQRLNANCYLHTTTAKAGQSVTKQIGWPETEENKKYLCGTLKQWFRSVNLPGVYCRVLMDECSTWIKDDVGRLGPEEGKFGDCVIAAGCAKVGDIWIENAPETVEPQPTGWLKKWQEGEL